MAIQQTSFTSPGYDYSADIAAIERKRKLSEALQAQALQPIEQTPTPAGGFVTPISPYQGLAKIATALAAKRQEHKAEQEQRALATKSQSDLASVLTNAQKAAAGTPGTPLSEDASGNVTPAQPAVPGDMSKAASLYMSDPRTAQLGAALMQKEIEGQQRQRLMERYMAPEAAGGATTGGPWSPEYAAKPGASPMAGLPPKIVGMLTSGDPEIAGVGKILAENYKMQNVRPGGTVFQPGVGPLFTAPQNGMQTTWGTQGPVSAPVQGAQEGAARGAGLLEAAKAPYTFHSVTNAAGATVPVSTANLVAGNNPAAASQPSQQPAPRPAPATPATPQAGDPWASIPKRVVPQGMGQTTYDRTLAEHQAGSANELSKKYGDLADHANQRKVLNDQSLSLVDQADTGPMAARIADVKNWLVSRAGVPEDHFKNTPSATLALQKDLLNAATQKAKAQFGARMTQSEVMLMLSKGAPNIDMTKAAIKYLIASDSAAADYQIKQANDLGRYLQSGGDPMKFDAWYSQSFPMTKAVSAVHMPQGQSGSGAIDWNDLKHGR